MWVGIFMYVLISLLKRSWGDGVGPVSLMELICM
jgi:hypothetical protein